MNHHRRSCIMLIIVSLVSVAFVITASAWTPVPVQDDPLVRMPGTQPTQVSIEGPNRCLNCHSGYDTVVEPGYNWKGSMMAQAARDFLFWACLTVAAQDSIWAVGTPNAVDICERCHFPKGWLEGRSDPPNASAMLGDDFDGVQCDFCHRMWDPFFEDTYTGVREGSDWLNYWDETNASATPSQPAADATYSEDMLLADAIVLFNGAFFFRIDNRPVSTSYMENASGQYFISPSGAKRASFADAEARHQIFYSRYHKSKFFCSTCHDVSNPVLANLGQNGTTPLTTETDPAYSYYHVERTFSEFMLSDYGLPGGSNGIGPFDASVFPTTEGKIRMCQDCHMRDVVGRGATMMGAPIRPDGSVEHPNSGLPLHDLTGGNAWVSYVLASAITGSPNYDAVNAGLLNQGPNVLTLDLTAGEGIDPAALIVGSERAKAQLQMAAVINTVTYNSSTGTLGFRVQNQTGHKLISGFPEGRRMIVNIRAYSGGDLMYEVNPYDYTVGTLKGLPNSLNSPPLDENEVLIDELVYEMHPSSSLTGEDESFHFALATGRYKDNRIPPKGFRIAEAAERHSEPVWHGVISPDYFTAEEYAGGYDDVSLTIAQGADTVEVRLYYQTTSREYMEFFRDEINGTGTTLTGTGAGGDPPYIAQTDPFFDKLKAWGDTLWQLWDHNRDVPGAAPFLMAQSTIEVAPPPPSYVGVFRNRTWYLDSNGTPGWNPGDTSFDFGLTTDIPVTGDWNGDGTTEVGVFRGNGYWFLDLDGDRAWSAGDIQFKFGTATDIPVSGDWDGNGTTDAGVFRKGTWYLDSNNTLGWNDGDTTLAFGLTNDVPVSGDWDGDGTTNVGVFRNGTWYLDSNGIPGWNAGDTSFKFGIASDIPVSGDWDGDGTTNVGVFRDGWWYLDSNGTPGWNAGDASFKFGKTGDRPVSGSW